MKMLLLLLTVVLFKVTVAQTTAIPDVNFEQALISIGLDTSADGAVTTANIDTLTSLNIAGKNIWDLTGIEDFIALKELDCSRNLLTSLDITQNLQLTSLRCNFNALRSLDVTQNLILTDLWCGNNKLSSLTISQNTDLTLLNCINNELKNLDVSQNTLLTDINCSLNQLISLDVSQNRALTDLFCDNNQLTSLDVSQNKVLKSLWCQDNLLKCLNVSNGNNANFIYFIAYDNSNLACIDVDNITYSTNNWKAIDSKASFSTNCSNPCVVGVDNLNGIFSTLNLYPNPTNGNLTIDLGEVKQSVQTTLTNNLGQIIFNQKFESKSLINIDVDAPSGIYFLQLETANGESNTIKVLKK